MEQFQTSFPSSRVLNFRPSIAPSCAPRICGTFVVKPTFVRLRVVIGESHLLLPHDILHEHVLQHYMFHASQPSFWMSMPSQNDGQHGSRESHHAAALSRDVSSQSLRQFQLSRADTSASTELRLTDCCVRDHAQGFVSSPHHSAACALVGPGLTCPVAVCVDVHRLRECDDFDLAVCTLRTLFWYRVMRFLFISSLSGRQRIFRNVSFTLYMMSARSWHTDSGFPTAVLYAARLRFPARPETQSLVFSSHVEPPQVSRPPVQTRQSRQSRLGCACDSRQVSASGSHDHSAKKEYLVVQLRQSSHKWAS